ncbi:DUF2513 domain-containing protein [Sphingomonas sp. 10B4]|uniref:DUF2513 domain-containing protein n=2 Tax=Sphingomonas sp. 10B4 TaxID=3048575 RepID=UPI002B2318B1|nr:DUF2513 domain-containing protein [Sphingomonas sp. 10B4]MEB0283819.1 DUF2513 domain-containing protein [Sphingomonas sp. 10B4]
MKRDMELIREIMLQLEVWPMEMGDAISMTPEAMQAEIPDRDLAEINHHMDLIRSAGFIDTGGAGSSGPMFGFIFMGLTMSGHDFLDSVRSPEVWRRTKAGAEKVGGVGLSVIVEMAKAYGKQVITEKLGITLG